MYNSYHNISIDTKININTNGTFEVLFFPFLVVRLTNELYSIVHVDLVITSHLLFFRVSP